MLNPVFPTRARIEVERGVILQEIGQSLDHARRRDLRLAAKGRLSRPADGLPPSNWPSRAREQLRPRRPVGLHHRALRPRRMIVAASGAVDRRQHPAGSGDLAYLFPCRHHAPDPPAGRAPRRAARETGTGAFRWPSGAGYMAPVSMLDDLDISAGAASSLPVPEDPRGTAAVLIFAQSGFPLTIPWSRCDLCGTSGDRSADLANLTIDREARRRGHDRGPRSPRPPS